MRDDHEWIVIPNWDRFQHRDVVRSESAPPWIKMYTRLLFDDDYLDLSLSQRGLLHGLWLLFAAHRGVLRKSTAKEKLGVSESDAKHWRRNLAALNDAGFVQFVDSKPLAGCAHDASLDKRREEPPLPPNGKTSKPRRRRRTTEPSYEDLNPYICGVDACTIRDSSEARIAEHRENVHATTRSFVPAGVHSDPADSTYDDDIPF